MPTLRQKRVAKLVATGSSVAEVMVQAGYSPKTARAPSKVTESKGFKELLNQYLPDEKLFAKHDEALEAEKWNDFTGEREADQSIRLRAVELGYKVKRILGPDVAQQFNVAGSMGIEFIKTDDNSGKAA